MGESKRFYCFGDLIGIVANSEKIGHAVELVVYFIKQDDCWRKTDWSEIVYIPTRLFQTLAYRVDVKSELSVVRI